MVELDMRVDIKAATKYLSKVERQVIPRATNRALNTTGRNVRTEIVRFIAKRTGLKSGEVKAGTTLNKSTFSTLKVEVVAHGKAVNLIRFVSKGKQAPGAFNRQLGVRANAWRKSRLYPGTFIVRGRGSGKLLVVARKGRQRNPLKAIAGPSIRLELARPEAKRLMSDKARQRFAINFQRDLRYYLGRL